MSTKPTDESRGPLDRFAEFLLDEARIADERAAEGDELSAVARDVLRARAESLDVDLDAPDRAALEQMSDEEMRVLAKALRLLIGHEGGGGFARSQRVARELLTAYWTAFERCLPEADRVYEEALDVAVEDSKMAADLVHQMTRIAVTAIIRGAAARGVEFDETLVDVYDAIREEDVVMARRRSLTSQLYKLARLSATGRSVRSGYAGRRDRNIVVGRAPGKAGVWWRFWK
ncbi:MAG: hypothetical protein ABSG95_13070 [Solirubrobacteraceae bacterium]|jgi:hypothetical protein